VLRQLGSILRRLRRASQRWSSSADREFHDALFTAQRYDPFSFAYPGYVTIRRFADLASARLGGVRRAVDLGCGPGEITCELARRHREIMFTGVDHSEVAIARAREHARALQLENVHFEAADIATFTPDQSSEIVLMFDSFHHLLDPAAFVAMWAARTERFLLIEPAGDWLGGWERTLDLDWIVPAFDSVRARIAWQLGVEAARDAKATKAGGASQDPPKSEGEAVEHRYTLEDFKQFFGGFGLQVRGTIAGIETYPPDPYGCPPLRDEFGKITYETIVEIENMLFQENLDLHAKHWVIYAVRGAPDALRTPRPLSPRDSTPAVQLQGPYDVEYVSYDGPREASASSTMLVSVTFKNRGWRTWGSDVPSAPVFMSYHWLEAHGTVAIDDGLRTPLPHAVVPGSTCAMTCRIETPPRPGRYALAIDLVEEGVTWFSRAGAQLLRINFRIR
jgi:SAM-dependent methyltransferase